MLRVGALALLLSLAIAPAVSAQGGYVSVSLLGDVVRVDHAERTGGSDVSGGGEALGFALRLGTEVGSRWGVEAEFARPSEIESSFAPGIVPLAWASSTSVVSGAPGGGVLPSIELFPYPYTYRVRTQQRYTTLSVAAWARQELSPRVSLVYLGGIGFQRTTQDVEITFEPSVPFGPIGRPAIFPQPSLTETIVYDAGPFTGIEARIALTDHVQLVPGVRLHGLDGGWLVRSSVGLGWVF
jgi:opacity protein-like surface antigen